MMSCLDIELSGQIISALDKNNRNTPKVDAASFIVTSILSTFFLVLYFVKDSSYTRFNANPQTNSYLNPELYPIKGFDLVRDSLKSTDNYNLAQPNDCFSYHTDIFPIPEFNPNEPSCQTNCIH